MSECYTNWRKSRHSEPNGDCVNGMTMRRWLARPPGADLMMMAIWLAVSAGMVLAIWLLFGVEHSPDSSDWEAVSVLALSFVAGPAAMVLRHGNRHLRLGGIGAELAADARRAAATMAVQPR